MSRPPLEPTPAAQQARLSERAFSAETTTLSALLDDLGLAAPAARFAEQRAARLLDPLGGRLEPATFHDLVSVLPDEQAQQFVDALREAVGEAAAADLVMPLVDTAQRVGEDAAAMLERRGQRR